MSLVKMSASIPDEDHYILKYFAVVSVFILKEGLEFFMSENDKDTWMKLAGCRGRNLFSDSYKLLQPAFPSEVSV